MRLPILFAVILMASPVAVANAQSPVTSVGFAKVLNSNNIRVTSFDNQWKAGGFGSHYAIFDQQNQPVFIWEPETFYQESVTVSWSLDSRHIVILDQQPRAAEFYCAVLENGQWHAIEQPTVDPQMPKDTKVTKTELGNWTSPTTVEITFRHLSKLPPKTIPEWVQYTTTLSFGTDSVSFAAE